MIIETRLNLTIYASGAKKYMLSPKIMNGVFNFWLLWDAQNSGESTRIAQSADPHKNKRLNSTSHNQKHELLHIKKSSDTIIRIGIGSTLDCVILEVKKWHLM